MFGPYLNVVERSAVNADGSLGPWEPMAAMTTPRVGLAAVAAGGYLYALGGTTGMGPPLNSVERAEIKSDGSLGPWELTTSMTMTRPGLSAVASDGYLYVLGGNNSVEYAPINADGSLGSWQVISAMTMERTELAAVAADGYLYALGSFLFSINATNSVERAAISVDGSLGPWEFTAPMTTPRSGFVAAVQDGYVYAFGGDTGDGTTRSVEFAATQNLQRRSTLYLPLVSKR